jgi:hypothetical protein
MLRANLFHTLGGKRGFAHAQPVKPGRCAMHSEMPITAAADNGDRSRNA